LLWGYRGYWENSAIHNLEFQILKNDRYVDRPRKREKERKHERVTIKSVAGSNNKKHKSNTVSKKHTKAEVKKNLFRIVKSIAPSRREFLFKIPGIFFFDVAKTLPPN